MHCKQQGILLEQLSIINVEINFRVFQIARVSVYWRVTLAKPYRKEVALELPIGTNYTISREFCIR